MARAKSEHIQKARRAFTDFTGHKADLSRVSKLDDNPVAGYRLGDLVGIAYEAKRDGVTDKYYHEFSKEVRPELVVKHDGSQLYIDGGQYAVTDHGIEDMPQLFVVNPSARSRKKTRTSKRKPAPMATRRRRRAVSKRRAPTFRANPAPVRRRRRYRRNPVMRVSRRRGYRRNPSGRGGKGTFNVMGVLLPGVTIGAGAVGAELLMGYLPIPAGLKTGSMRHVIKAGVSVAAGWAIGKWFNKKAGEAFALGGVAIAAHDAIKGLIVTAMPGARFGIYTNPDALGYYNAGLVNDASGLGQYIEANAGMAGAYDSDVSVFQA